MSRPILQMIDRLLSLWAPDFHDNAAQNARYSQLESPAYLRRAKREEAKQPRR